MLLGMAVIGSMTLFAFKASSLKSTSKFEFYSKETFILAGNIALVTATATVLLGTLYPLLTDAMNLGKVSVGPPYYNLVFNPIILAMTVMMGIAPLIRWKKNKVGTFRSELGLIAIVSVVFGIAFPFVYGGEFIGWVAVGMGLAFWLVAATLKNASNSIKHPQGGVDWSRPTQSYWGMVVSHVGIAVAIVGATLVSFYETQLDIRMDVDSRVELSGYEFVFEGISDVEGPNYSAKQGQFSVFANGEKVAYLRPERRIYRVQTMGMTEAGIDSTIARDLFIALGDPLDKGAWAVRVYVKPYINLLWIAGFLIALGGFICLGDRRYRSSKASAKQTVTPPTSTVTEVNA